LPVPDRYPGPALPEHDSDPDPFQPYVKLNCISKKSIYCPNFENYDTSDAYEKDKTMWTGTACE
jgi:hypothetical protein